MAARLREAQAQAELRALRQRVLQLETQVGGGGKGGRTYWEHWEGWGWGAGGWTGRTGRAGSVGDELGAELGVWGLNWGAGLGVLVLWVLNWGAGVGELGGWGCGC